MAYRPVGSIRYQNKTWLATQNRFAEACVHCQAPLPKGTQCYRPLDEGGRGCRRRRLCSACADDQGVPLLAHVPVNRKYVRKRFRAVDPPKP
jgi:hypothetical protein